MSSMRRNTRTSQSPRISFSNVSGALRTRISLWSLRFSLSKVVGIVLWILQGVNDHVAVTLRYRVDRFTLNCAAMSCTGTSFERSSVRMVFSSLGLSFFGRPPLRPRARAALRPASERSRIKLRSNSEFCSSLQNAEYAEPAVMRSDAIEIEVWPALWPLGAPHNIQGQGRQRMRDCGEVRQQGLGCLA